MRGGLSLPYRPPCGGWTGKIFLSGPYKHYRAAEDGFDRYVFDAKVPDYRNNTGASGGPDPAYNAAGIDPYPRYVGFCDRPSCGENFQGGCGVSNCNQCFNSYGSPISPITEFGYAWIGPVPLAGVGTYGLDTPYNIANPAPLHWSHTPGDKKNFSKCHKRGHKIVMAHRAVHGNWGKLSENVGGWSGGDINLVTGATCLIPLEYNATPDNTKYTSATCVVHMERNNGTFYQFDATAHAGVGKLTGVKAADWSFSGNSIFLDGVSWSCDCPLVRPISPPPGWTASASGLLQAIFDMDRARAVAYFFKSLTGYETITKLSGSQWKGENSDGSYKIITCNFVDSFGTESYTPGAYGGSGTTESESLSLSNTVADYSWSKTNSSDTQAVTLSCTFANSHTADDELTDLEDNLLIVWPLNDDTLYPWREDGVLSVGPLVLRREVQGDVAMELHMDFTTDSSGLNATPNPYTDPASDYCDGAIIGGPNPAGYEDTFDYYWAMWKACLPTDPDALKILQWYEDSVGGNYARITGWLGGAQFPKNTTLFPSNIQAFCNRPGAWVAVNDPTTTTDHYNNGGGAMKSGVWEAKYAEIPELLPSEDFARPAGADRFAYDETKVYAVGSDLTTPASGGTFTPRDLYGNAITIADTSGVWGGPAVGGFYNISQAGTLVTLGTKVYSVPTGWKSASGDDAACFGKLRWPNYPGILGRAAVSLVENLSPVKLTTESLPNVVTSDTVDLYDASMTLLAGNVAVTRVDDTHFTVGTAYATIAACKYITAAGKKYYFDTDRPKGDYTVLEWTFDFRTNGERARLLGSVNGCTGDPMIAPTANNGFSEFNQTQGCLPFTPCSPKVICYSPNGETFANGITYPPPRPALDYRFGTLWLGLPQTSMTSLFYQPPHSPVTVSDSLTETDFDPAYDRLIWREDDGSCPDDYVETAEGGGMTFHKFYPHHPMVEARLSLPNNSGMAMNETPPALPAGIQIGWLSPVDHTGDGVAYPPGIVGFNEDGSLAGMATPWSISAALCAAAKSGCRFADIYRQQIAGCPQPSTGSTGGGGTTAPAFSAGSQDVGAGSTDAGAGAT